MNVTFFKRYRMHFDLENEILEPPVLPSEYRFVPWKSSRDSSSKEIQALILAHADAKYRSFRNELDSAVFPCLGDTIGCKRLMREISARRTFIPGATWLIQQMKTTGIERDENCATIQALIDPDGIGSIQNVGVVPEHRGNGLGRALLVASLGGMKAIGLSTGSLEVTSENVAAIRLYQSMGFTIEKIVYKPIEVPTPS